MEYAFYQREDIRLSPMRKGVLYRGWSYMRVRLLEEYRTGLEMCSGMELYRVDSFSA